MEFQSTSLSAFLCYLFPIGIYCYYNLRGFMVLNATFNNISSNVVNSNHPVRGEV
jgi:hypothetical protein